MVIVRKLIWDSWNVNHIARHNVIPDEVEETSHNDPKTEQGYKKRIFLLGTTRNGRILAIVLEPDEKKDIYYPITARDASRKERKRYNDWKRGE